MQLLVLDVVIVGSAGLGRWCWEGVGRAGRLGLVGIVSESEEPLYSWSKTLWFLSLHPPQIAGCVFVQSSCQHLGTMVAAVLSHGRYLAT